MIRRSCAVRSLIFTVAVAAAFTPLAEAQAPGAKIADPTSAIVAKHKAADEDYAKAVMSPFTAVAVQYFQPGQTLRMGIGPAGVTFGPGAAGVDAVELTFQDGAYFVSPVAGATPSIVKTSGNGDVTGLPGTPVTARTKLERRDVVRLGRYFVETLSAPGNGNARVFDPESPARKAYRRVEVVPAQPRVAGEGAFRGEPGTDRGDHHDEPRACSGSTTGPERSSSSWTASRFASSP